MQSVSVTSTANVAELLAVAKEAAEHAVKLDTELRFQEAINKYVESIELLSMIAKCEPNAAVQRQYKATMTIYLERAEYLKKLMQKFQAELCVIDYSNPRDCVFLPCGHVATCFACGTKLQYCPICRAHIDKVMKTFKA